MYAHSMCAPCIYAYSMCACDIKDTLYIHVFYCQNTFFTLVTASTSRQSACCTHVSALLHALAALTPTSFPSEERGSNLTNNEEAIPVTSLPCQWKAPRKRKDSTMQLSQLDFEKHVYGRRKKRNVGSLEDFDPRPERYRGTAKQNLPALLDRVRGQGLCVSLLFDPRACHHDEGESTSKSVPNLPSCENLQQTIAEFKKSLQVTSEEIRSIERKTVGQRHSPMWFMARRFRITASVFGEVLRRKPDTPPDNLVYLILSLVPPLTEQYMTHHQLMSLMDF